jgi:hypothetical protein
LKYRLDHITNSSSASFVVAIKKGTSQEEIEKVVESQRKVIEEQLNDFLSWGEYTEEECEKYGFTLEHFMNELVSYFTLIAKGAEGSSLDQTWQLDCFESSTEDEPTIYSMFHYMNIKDSDDIKVIGGSF